MGAHDRAMPRPGLAAPLLNPRRGLAVAEALPAGLPRPGRLLAQGPGWRALVSCDGATGPTQAAAIGQRVHSQALARTGGRRDVGADSADPTAGSGWDLLFHVATHGLPLQLVLGAAARLNLPAVWRRVSLDGRSLRLEAATFTLWLDETAVWFESDEPGSALVGHGLRLQLADTATRPQAGTWQRLVAAVRLDQPVHTCSC